jgi:hypothetical protein
VLVEIQSDKCRQVESKPMTALQSIAVAALINCWQAAVDPKRTSE